MATIITKNSSTASSVPLNTQLVQGELAVNVTDKRLFTENASGTVVELGTNPSSLTLPNGTANGVAYLNGSKALTSGSALVFDGSNLGLGVTPSAKLDVVATNFAGGPAIGARYNTSNARMGFNIANANGFPYIGYNTNNASASDTPTYDLSQAATQLRMDGGQFRFGIAPSGTAGNAISFTQAMTLDASGRLGIGRTSPAQQLDVNGQILATNIYLNSDDSDVSWGSGSGSRPLIRGNTTNNTLQFYTASAERARIDSSGNLLVGTTDNSITSGPGVKIAPNIGAAVVSTLSTNSNSCSHVYSTGAGAYRFYVGWGGTVYATSTSISAISDATLKENVRDLETGLTEVMALRPRRFDWKNGDAQNVAGFVAQEVEQVLPELVTDYQYSEGVTKKSLKMGDILPTLVNAIQEQQAIITALTARIEVLEAK